MEFETLVLSRSDLRKLRDIKNAPEENTREAAESLSFLLDSGFVSLQNCEDGKGNIVSAFFITADGENYLRYLKRRKTEFWIPTGISLVAVLISLMAFIRAGA